MADVRGRRRFMQAVTAAALALGVGCGGIPTDGQVTPIKEVVDPAVAGGDRELDRPVRRIADPKPPVPGAPPADIVRGFFDAHAANDHDIARLFLAPNASWSDRGVLIYGGERTVEQLVAENVEGRAVVRVLRQAQLSTTGEYAPTVPASIPLEVTLQKVAAEWRLSKVPQGLVLSDLAFRSSFRRVVLYHPEPGRRHLVPDFVFLPESSSSPSHVLDALLRGPSRWLQPAVRTAVPPGTRVLGSPRVVDGVADVDLSLEANGTPTDARAALAAQIVRTLTEPGLGITGVRLRVEGRRFPIPGTQTGEVMTRGTWSEYEPVLKPSDERLYFLDRGDLKALDSESQSVVTAVAAADYLRIAVSRRKGLLAATRRQPDGRQVLLVGPIGGSQRSTAEGDSLSTPSWSRESDLVWVVRRNGPATDVVAIPAAVASERRVRVDGAVGPLQEVRLSPDGNRAMLVVGEGRGRRLYAARVESTPALALTGLRPVGPTLSDVSAVSWYSDRGVQVVATNVERGQAPVRSIFRLDVDGYGLTGDISEIDGLSRPPDVIAAAPTRVTVVEVRGTIFKKVSTPNSLWTVIGPGSGPTYAG